VFDQLAVADPEDVDELELHAIAGRRQIPEFAEVRPPERLAGSDEIALGELLVDLHGGIGESLQQRAVERLEAARRPARLRDGPAAGPVVVHESRVEDLVRERQVVLILTTFYELSHDTLAVVPRHPHLPTDSNDASPYVAAASPTAPGADGPIKILVTPHRMEIEHVISAMPFS
jgi:hypothetical protein